MSHGLWHEIEKYVVELLGQSDYEDMESLPLINDDDDSHSSVDFDTKPPIRDEAQVHLPAEHDTYEPEPTMARPSHEEYMVREIPQNATEDVEAIKEMYILGKRVGKDLVDSSGRLVARNGERITRDIIRHAEQTGKLVELIVNMTFDHGQRSINE